MSNVFLKQSMKSRPRVVIIYEKGWELGLQSGKSHYNFENLMTGAVSNDWYHQPSIG